MLAEVAADPVSLAEFQVVTRLNEVRAFLNQCAVSLVQVVVFRNRQVLGESW